MMSKDPQTDAAARNLIAQYGEDAETIAMLRAAEFAAAGDVKALGDWDRIIEAIRLFLAAGEPGASADALPPSGPRH
jgi:hypothetical protein